jgi:hypothetical protein
VKVDDVGELYSAAPFQPFEIVLTNGGRVLVDHSEFTSLSRDYRTVHVHARNGGDQRIDTKLIVALNELKNGSRSRKRKR